MEGRKLGYFVSACVFVAFPLILSLKFEIKKTWLIVLLNILWAMGMVFAVLLWSFMSVYLLPKDLFALKPIVLCLNIAIVLFVAFLVLLICPRWKLAFNLASALMFMLVFAAWLVWEFRGKVLIFSDIYAARTAMNVVSQHSLNVHARAAIGITVFIAVFILQFTFPELSIASKIRMRLISLVSAVTLAGFTYIGSNGINTRLWSNEGFLYNGFILNYFLSVQDSFIPVPEGYGMEVLSELERAYPAADEKTGDYPDIIVIMNESFADFGVYGDAFRTDKEPAPFFNSLHENTVRGYAYCSVFGGGTSNSEFEVLTGMTMAMLPENSTPYEQYIKNELLSLPYILKDYGYLSFATHPYDSSGWSRTKVYPLLGFDGYSFIEDYPQEDMVRSYVGDHEMYEYILEKQRNEYKDKNLFLFGVTMQNHGGYTASEEDFENTVKLEGYSVDYPQAEQCLSLINKSDEALKFFIEELEKTEKDTVVLFFGDHFPNVEKAFYDELSDGSNEQELLKYKVPFLIWANYDIEEKEIEYSSLNYLGRYLLQAAGIELTPYYTFLEEMEEIIPSICSRAYYSKENAAFISLDEATGVEKQWLDKQRILQYNNLHDKDNLSEHFFGISRITDP